VSEADQTAGGATGLALEAPSRPSAPMANGGLPAWGFCMIAAAIPLAAFLVAIETLTTGGMIFDFAGTSDVWGDTRWAPDAAHRITIALFDYASLIFAHGLLSAGLAIYFMAKLRRYRYPVERWAICWAASLAVILLVFTACREDMAFRGFLIDPLVEVWSDVQRAPMRDAEARIWLEALLLLPVAMGIVVVVLGTAAFHAGIFLPLRTRSGRPAAATVEEVSVDLRYGLIALSLVLVSSVITARGYLALVRGIGREKDGVLNGFLDTMTHALATGSGLLFSATLVAAFTPGVVVIALLRAKDVGDDDEDSGDLLTGLLANLGKTAGGLRGAIQSLTALAAPAMVAPVMDILLIGAG